MADVADARQRAGHAPALRLAARPPRACALAENMIFRTPSGTIAGLKAIHFGTTAFAGSRFAPDVSRACFSEPALILQPQCAVTRFEDQPLPTTANGESRCETTARPRSANHRSAAIQMQLLSVPARHSTSPVRRSSPPGGGAG